MYQWAGLCKEGGVRAGSSGGGSRGRSKEGVVVASRIVDRSRKVGCSHLLGGCVYCRNKREKRGQVF
jgi:hypothetical protein